MEVGSSLGMGRWGLALVGRTLLLEVQKRRMVWVERRRRTLAGLWEVLMMNL